MTITPVLIVQHIETSLPFWVDRIGFEKTVEVPDGDALGFVILVRGDAELMLQTAQSVAKDEPKFAPVSSPGPSSLFVEVEHFEDILQRLDTYPIAMQERTTFYGMREIGVFEPSGHIVVFASRV